MARNLIFLGALSVLVCAGWRPAMAQSFDDRADLSISLGVLKESEPTVRQVQQAALRYFNVNRDQVDSMRSRASAKGGLPILEVSGGYTNSTVGEDTVNFEFHPQDPWIMKALGGSAYEVRGKLTWNLPMLLFNAEELDVASVAGLVEGILKEATRLYFMRRRLQVELLLSPPTDRATLLSKEIRLEELTALIDAMTGGWFSQSIERLRAIGARTPAPVPAATRAPATIGKPSSLPAVASPPTSDGAKRVGAAPASPKPKAAEATAPAASRASRSR